MKYLLIGLLGLSFNVNADCLLSWDESPDKTPERDIKYNVYKNGELVAQNVYNLNENGRHEMTIECNDSEFFSVSSVLGGLESERTQELGKPAVPTEPTMSEI